jgi:hypothetical protein
MNFRIIFSKVQMLSIPALLLGDWNSFLDMRAGYPE